MNRIIDFLTGVWRISLVILSNVRLLLFLGLPVLLGLLLLLAPMTDHLYPYWKQVPQYTDFSPFGGELKDLKLTIWTPVRLYPGGSGHKLAIEIENTGASDANVTMTVNRDQQFIRFTSVNARPVTDTLPLPVMSKQRVPPVIKASYNILFDILEVRDPNKPVVFEVRVQTDSEDVTKHLEVAVAYWSVRLIRMVALATLVLTTVGGLWRLFVKSSD
jgi:hypothetical protein